MALGTAAATAASLTMSPWLRRQVVKRAFVVVTPHRIRTACAEARIQNRKGQLPVVLRTRGTATGERVTLWCRAGTSVRDVAQARPVFTAACWARDVVVTKHARWSHIAVVDVIRWQAESEEGRRLRILRRRAAQHGPEHRGPAPNEPTEDGPTEQRYQPA